MSKLTTNLSILFGLALLMLTGCEQDTTATLPQPGEEPAEVLFSARIASAQVTTRVENYNDEKTSFNERDKIGLFTWRNSITVPNQHLANIMLVSDENGNNLTADGQKIYFPLQTEALQLSAYHPYSTEAVSGSTVKVRSELQEGDAYTNYITDPLWAQKAITKSDIQTNPTVTLNFSHCMARLKIYVYTTSTTTDYYLENIQVVYSLRQAGTLDLMTGKITTAEMEDTYYDHNYTTNNQLPTSETGVPQYDHTILPAETLPTGEYGIPFMVSAIVIKVSYMEGDVKKSGEYIAYYARDVDSSQYIKPSSGKTVRVNIKFDPSTSLSSNINGWNSEETTINTPHAR